MPEPTTVLDDPGGNPLAQVRPVRDDIERGARGGANRGSPVAIHTACTTSRWVLTAGCCASSPTALMTDAYPPFRLDQGVTGPAEPTGPVPSGPEGAVRAPEGGARVPAACPAGGAL